MSHNILVVDDDERQLIAYQNLFMASQDGALSELETFFAPNATVDASPVDVDNHFNVIKASQGQEAIDLVAESLEKNDPISVAFIDMRMPPGMNGLETAKQIRDLDSRVYIVIVTAYSDFDLRQITSSLKENVLFIRKPFQSEEIEQIARNFVQSWDKDRDLKALKHKLEERVKENLFEAAMYEVSNSVLLTLADKVTSQFGLVSYLKTEFDIAPHQKDDYDKIAHTIFSESQQLALMVSALQKMALPSDEITVFSIKDVMTQVTSLMPELKSLPNNIEFEVDIQFGEDLTFHLPCNRLVIALTSILYNALEAITAQLLLQPSLKARITLSITQVDNSIELLLMDNGIGLKSDQLDRVFEQGFSTKPDHSGIGLTIVQQFLDLVNGKAWLKSDGLGKGAVIRMHFPIMTTL